SNSKVNKLSKVNAASNRRKVSNKASSKVNNRDNSKDSNNVSEVSRGNPVSKVRSRVSRTANRQAAVRTVVTRKPAEEIAAASIVQEQSAAIGATIANCLLRFVNDCVKRR